MVIPGEWFQRTPTKATRDKQVVLARRADLTVRSTLSLPFFLIIMFFASTIIQWYVTPTMSPRKLSERKSYNRDLDGDPAGKLVIHHYLVEGPQLSRSRWLRDSNAILKDQELDAAHNLIIQNVRL